MAIGPLGVRAAHFGKPKNERKQLMTLSTGSMWGRFGYRRTKVVEF